MYEYIIALVTLAKKSARFGLISYIRRFHHRAYVLSFDDRFCTQNVKLPIMFINTYIRLLN